MGCCCCQVFGFFFFFLTLLFAIFVRPGAPFLNVSLSPLISVGVGMQGGSLDFCIILRVRRIIEYDGQGMPRSINQKKKKHIIFWCVCESRRVCVHVCVFMFCMCRYVHTQGCPCPCVPILRPEEDLQCSKLSVPVVPGSRILTAGLYGPSRLLANSSKNEHDHEPGLLPLFPSSLRVVGTRA